MERLPDQHLNLYELRLLASDSLCVAGQLLTGREKKELDSHVLGCPECRELLLQEQLLLQMVKQVPTDAKAGPDCSSEQEWMEFAAGLHTTAKTRERLEHANGCAFCSSQLRQASERFADDVSDEEKGVLDNLASADSSWQLNLAKQMQAVSSGTNAPRSVPKGRVRIRFLRFGIAAASATLIILTITWFNYLRPSRAAVRLLSLAYSEQRTMELRMTGARYAPVTAFRGAETSELPRPTPLLEADVIIAKELRSKPDDPFWLDAQGKADLQVDNYASALAVLERARLYAPEDPTIRVDLASAYFLRGEELKRSEDYGHAVEILGQVLAKNPGDEIARFNRAVASERLLLYDQAVEDWQRYLEIDPSSPWSDEARRRLIDVQEKINLQRKRSERPLLGPAEFVALLREYPTGSRDGRDLRTEQYLDLALREWVPEAFSKARGSKADIGQRALYGLARILVSEHGDYWLHDFLHGLQQRPLSRAGLPYIANFLRLNQGEDLDQARKSAIDAAGLFHKTGNRAGELMAQFESSYADQLSHQVSNCLTEARFRDDPDVKRSYPWIRAQLSLESAACTNLNDESARRSAAEALALARLHHYPSLELRAKTFLAELYQYLGDHTSAWKYSTEGLARYWEGDYPTMRGYSLYLGLDLVAEDSEEWFLDSQILQEASKFIADDPDLELRAVEQQRLANALAMTGDFTAAASLLRNTDALFRRSADGTRRENLELEARVDLAKLHLLQSDPSSAIRLLEPLRQKANALSDQDLIFDYFRNLGLAYFALGVFDQADHDLGHALGLAEASLGMNRDERERHIWCRKADRVYRAMVQLNLRHPPRDAFAIWEWFKGASLRGHTSVGRSPTPENGALLPAWAPSLSFAVPADTVIISYAVLPQGTFAWTYSQEDVRQHPLTVSPQEIQLLSHRFVDHCARPDSDMATVSLESRVLYQKLIAPLESSLRSYKHLVIEPDQALWLIPFEALLDRDGVYLGDRFSISLSPGLDYLAASSPWLEVTPENRILIVGDPDTNGRKPLDDAEEEAKGIARRFRYNKLLLRADAGYGRIAEQISEADIFHFSGHAAASPDSVGLLLGDSSVMDAARIRVSEFSHLKLAVLSACKSANGATGIFDDRDSLARLLVGAGVLEVVASRWMVDSRATAALMKEFYAQLLSGEDVSSALQNANRKLRSASSEFAHPYYWASFSAFGKS